MGSDGNKRNGSARRAAEQADLPKASIEGWRKVLVAAVALVVESAMFALMIAQGKATPEMFTAYVGGVNGTLLLFVGANVLSKKIANGKS